MNLAQLYRVVRTRLTEAEVEAAAYDARLIIDRFAGAKPEDIVCKPLTEIAPQAVAEVDAAVVRRLAGEPVHRIVGWREFHGLKLAISRDTLEPRPDTETLVDAVLPFVRKRVEQTGRCRILDLGTGTGAISLALLNAEPKALAVATDISDGALETAQANAEALGLSERFEVVKSDWLNAVVGRFDLIVSNPPYIRSQVIQTLDANVRDYDPQAALDGGEDGLVAYRTIAGSSALHMAENGLLALEIGFDQTESVTALFAGAGFAVDPVRRDLGGNDRVLLVRMRQ